MAVKDLTFRLMGQDKSASKTFDGVGRKADGLGSKLSKLGGSMAGGALGAGAVSFVKGSVEAFKASEESAAKLSTALSKFPAGAGTTAAALGKINEGLATKTKYDDDALASGQAVLASFGLTGKQLEDMTPLLADYASRTGKSLPDAAQDLGKAMQGQGKALKAVGLDFKSSGDKAKDFDNLVGGLRKQVGGYAASEGKTAAGQSAILGNRFGELQESLGKKLVPALTKATEGMLKMVTFVEKNADVIGPLVLTVGGFAASVIAVNKASQAFKTTQAALNVVMRMNPIGLTVTALGLLATGLYLAWKKSETFRDVTTGAFTALASGAATAIDNVLGGFQWMAEQLAKVPFIGDKFKGVAEGIQGARDKVFDINLDIQGLKNKTVLVDVKMVDPNLVEVSRALERASLKVINFPVTGSAPAPRNPVAGPYMPRNPVAGPYMGSRPGTRVDPRPVNQTFNIHSEANPKEIAREVGRQVRFAS